MGFGGTFIPAISLLEAVISSLWERREEPEEPKTMRAFSSVCCFVVSSGAAGAGVGGGVLEVWGEGLEVGF